MLYAPVSQVVTHVGLVACCSEKLDVRCHAEDLYISPWFRKARDYVKQRCGRWAILSAKHGLLLPQAPVAPYDATLKVMPRLERLRWERAVHGQLVRTFGEDAHFIVVAGAAYAKALRGLSHEIPFAGMGIGQQLAALNEALAAQEVLA
jgi:hypothetical protein